MPDGRQGAGRPQPVALARLRLAAYAGRVGGSEAKIIACGLSAKGETRTAVPSKDAADRFQPIQRAPKGPKKERNCAESGREWTVLSLNTRHFGALQDAVYRSVNGYVVESVQSGCLLPRILHQEEGNSGVFLHLAVIFEIERANTGFSIARIQKGAAK